MSAEFNAIVALAWTRYTSRLGVDPSTFTDMEKIAFQAGVFAGMTIGMAQANKMVVDTLGGEQ